MTPSFDAAWTDAVLATAALGTAAWAARRTPRARLTAVGLALLGLAAAVGTFRLGGVAALGPLHDALSRLAGLVAIPMAALGVLLAPIEPGRRRLEIAALLLAVPLGALAIAAPDLAGAVRTPVSGSALVAALLASVWRGNPGGVLGPLLVLVAGLVIAGDGQWLGFARDGWFHLAMAAAALALGRAAVHDP